MLFLQEPITTVNEGQSETQHIEDTYAGKHKNISINCFN